MNEQKKSERDLVESYVNARTKHAQAKEHVQNCRADLDQAEHDLVQLLMDQDKHATAKYDGIGFVSLVSPALYASYRKDNEEILFKYLIESGREDLVRQSVNSKSLSSFVKDQLADGREIPKCINYVTIPKLRLYEK